MISGASFNILDHSCTRRGEREARNVVGRRNEAAGGPPHANYSWRFQNERRENHICIFEQIQRSRKDYEPWALLHSPLGVLHIPAHMYLGPPLIAPASWCPHACQAFRAFHIYTRLLSPTSSWIWLRKNSVHETEIWDFYTPWPLWIWMEDEQAAWRVFQARQTDTSLGTSLKMKEQGQRPVEYDQSMESLDRELPLLGHAGL